MELAEFRQCTFIMFKIKFFSMYIIAVISQPITWCGLVCAIELLVKKVYMAIKNHWNVLGETTLAQILSLSLSLKGTEIMSGGFWLYMNW